MRIFKIAELFKSERSFNPELPVTIIMDQHVINEIESEIDELKNSVSYKLNDNDSSPNEIAGHKLGVRNFHVIGMDIILVPSQNRLQFFELMNKLNS